MCDYTQHELNSEKTEWHFGKTRIQQDFILMESCFIYLKI